MNKRLENLVDLIEVNGMSHWLEKEIEVAAAGLSRKEVKKLNAAIRGAESRFNGYWDRRQVTNHHPSDEEEWVADTFTSAVGAVAGSDEWEGE